MLNEITLGASKVVKEREGGKKKGRKKRKENRKERKKRLKPGNKTGERRNIIEEEGGEFRAGTAKEWSKAFFK